MSKDYIMFIVFGAFILYTIGSYYRSYMRRYYIKGLAQRFGMRYIAKQDRKLPEQFKFLDLMQKGGGRYAYNLMEGKFKGYYVKFFNYYYNTGTLNHPRDHEFNVVMLDLESAVTEICIYPNGILTKLNHMLGNENVDFGRGEFSRLYCVSAVDEELARAICHSDMQHFLINNPSLNIEIERNWVAIIYKGLLNNNAIKNALEQIVAFRERFPETLMNSQN